MTVPNPSILLVMKETTGTTVVNYGNNGGDYVIEQGVENTNWEWHPNADSLLAYFESLNGGGGGMPWMDTAATPSSGDLVPISVAVGLNLSALGLGDQSYIVSSTESTVSGDVNVVAMSPTSTGDFNLVVEFVNNGGVNVNEVYEDLSFNTEYRISASVDTTDPTNCIFTWVLDQGSPRTKTANFNSFAFEAAWPFVLRRADFSDFFGVQGRIHYIVYDREGVAWTDSDMLAINDDPSAEITGWPTDSQTVTGTGDLTASNSIISGSGQVGRSGTGAISAAAGFLSGVGQIIRTITGTGSLIASAGFLSGRGAGQHGPIEGSSGVIGSSVEGSGVVGPGIEG